MTQVPQTSTGELHTLNMAYKGIKWTQEQIENRAKALRGKKRTKEQKERMSKARLALKIKISPEEIARRTETRRKNGWNKNPEKTKSLMSQNNARANLGRKQSDEERLKKSLAMTGEKSHSWKGGMTPIHDRIRKSAEYQIWREHVLKRDNYTCQFCKKRGGKLHADHIKPFALHPDLRFELSNGRTLCIPCHHTTDTHGYRKMYRLPKT